MTWVIARGAMIYHAILLAVMLALCEFSYTSGESCWFVSTEICLHGGQQFHSNSLRSCKERCDKMVDEVDVKEKCRGYQYYPSFSTSSRFYCELFVAKSIADLSERLYYQLPQCPPSYEKLSIKYCPHDDCLYTTSHICYESREASTSHLKTKHQCQRKCTFMIDTENEDNDCAGYQFREGGDICLIFSRSSAARRRELPSCSSVGEFFARMCPFDNGMFNIEANGAMGWF